MNHVHKLDAADRCRICKLHHDDLPPDALMQGGSARLPGPFRFEPGTYVKVEHAGGIAWIITGRCDDVEYFCDGHDDRDHPDGAMGESWYCDGSCTQRPAHSDCWLVRMVGDDRSHHIDEADLTPIGEDEFCPGCGQMGCGHYQ